MRLPLITLLSFSIALASHVMANSPDAVVTFQEIHYNPPVSQDAEWIELHNQMAVNVDISGWKLANGVDFTFPQGTIIQAGTNLIIAKLPAHPSLVGISGVLGPYTGSLSNSGETIELRNRSNRLMDRLSYGDSGSWPLAADGLGATLAKKRPGLASEPAENWRASQQIGGTPQQTNFLYSLEPIVSALIQNNQAWKYRDATTAPPTDWASTTFADTSWSSGNGSFGSAATTPILSTTASLTSRYRAGAITGLNDNTIVTTWTDGYSADGSSQNLSYTSDPRFETNSTLNGEPTVSFDGDDAMVASVTPGIAPNSGFVYFIVCKASVAMTNGSITSGDGAYIFDRIATVGDPLVSLKVVNGRYGFQKRYNDSNGLGGPVSSTAVSTSQYQIVTLRRNLSAARFEVWVNGVMEASETDTGGALTPQPIVLGNHASISNSGFKGDVAELLIYNNELSTNDFLAVGSYLEAKYGLTTSFPNATVNTTVAATSCSTISSNTRTTSTRISCASCCIHTTGATSCVCYS